MYELAAVTGAAVLPDDRIVIANGFTQELRFFDQAGNFLNSVGQEGSGPGEFRLPRLLPANDYDSLLIADFLANRYTFIGTDGGVGRIFVPEGGPTEALGWHPDGAVLVKRSGVSASLDSPEGIRPNEITFSAVDLQGGTLQAIAQLPGARVFLSTNSRQIAFTAVPFDGSPSGAVGPEGFYLTPGTLPEVRVYGADRKLRRVARVLREPDPLAQGEFDAFVEREIQEADDPTFARELRRRYSQMPVPQVKPVYRSLIVDATGHVWAEHHHAHGDSPTRWTIFEPEGAAIGTVEVPGGLLIYQIGDDYILARMRDSLRVEYVVLYELARS